MSVESALFPDESADAGSVVASEVRCGIHSLDYGQKRLAEEADGTIGKFDLEGTAILRNIYYFTDTENLVRHLNTNTIRIFIDGTVRSKAIIHITEIDSRSAETGLATTTKPITNALKRHLRTEILLVQNMNHILGPAP